LSLLWKNVVEKSNRADNVLPMVNFNSNIPEELRRKLEAEMAKASGGDLIEINEVLQAHTNSYNQTPLPELQGYSPAMCHALRHVWNSPDSPIQFNSGLQLDELRHSKVFHDIRTILLAVQEADGVKATTTGNFNRKFVAAMIDPLLDAREKEHLLRYNKVLNEPDFGSLHEGRIVANAAGLLVKRKGMIRVAKKHQALLDEAEAGALFTRLFDAYFRKYNIGYRYRWGLDVDWIQHQIRFILYPLSLKARNWMAADTFADAILHPMVLEDLRRQLSGQSFSHELGVITRYFVQPLHEWGLLEIQWCNEPCSPEANQIKLSPLFSKFIHFNETVE